MPMLEGQVDAVIGVDTRRDRHAAARLDPNGGVGATLQVSSDQAGYARLLRLADEQAPGRRVWALEGTGCYGAGLTRLLVDQGEWVVEIDRPKRPQGRHGAKSDALDAIRAGREALARDHLTTPRQRGHREAIRMLHTIVMLRQTHHGPTRAYTSRRIAQSKSQREIRHCLERTVAGQLYRLLERTATN